MLQMFLQIKGNEKKDKNNLKQYIAAQIILKICLLLMF